MARILKPSVMIFLALGLSACMTSGIDPNQLTTNRNGNVVTGKAGSNWADEELRANSFGAVCNSEETVSQLQIQRDETGAATFSAVCI